MPRTINRHQARHLGLAAIVAVFALQAFNSFACYGHGIGSFLAATAVFVGLPMLPAVIGWFSANPLRAVGASMAFAPWLLLAYWTDCVRPYAGGGASMVYVAVLMYGFASALAGALLTGPVMRLLGWRLPDTGAAT